jgi:hypothetical protein
MDMLWEQYTTQQDNMQEENFEAKKAQEESDLKDIDLLCTLPNTLSCVMSCKAGG